MVYYICTYVAEIEQYAAIFVIAVRCFQLRVPISYSIFYKHCSVSILYVGFLN